MNTITEGKTGEIIGGEETKREYSDEYKRLWVQFACAFADQDVLAADVARDGDAMMREYEQRFGEV